MMQATNKTQELRRYKEKPLSSKSHSKFHLVLFVDHQTCKQLIRINNFQKPQIDQNFKKKKGSFEIHIMNVHCAQWTRKAAPTKGTWNKT
jgi:hypothetical protein